MKLLIVTQKINKSDPVLGFFHHWVEMFAKHFDFITVICLEKGEYSLPENVKVLSLGKERNVSRIEYLRHFYSYIIRERKNYDAVFVHMNQEYVLLGSAVWGILGKKIFMWRNHGVGNFLTSIAANLCDKTFCTSKYSYTNRFKKNVLMPVGVDTDQFFDKNQARTKDILFLARMAPLKRPHLLIEALLKLKEKGVSFTASFYGSADSANITYFDELKKNAKSLGDSVKFYGAVSQDEVSAVYNIHKISVNLSPSGMFDKTIFEAALCGALALSSNENLRGEVDEALLFEENSLDELVSKLEALLLLPEERVHPFRLRLRGYATKNHSLVSLADKLHAVMNDPKSKRPFVGTILKFIISGGTSAVVDILFLYIFNAVFNIGYIVSSILAFLVAFGVSFTLQKFWTFQDDSEKVKGQIAVYFLLTSFNLFLNTLLMYLLVDKVPLPHFLTMSHEYKVLISQIIASGIIAVQSFFVYQKFVFTSIRK